MFRRKQPPEGVSKRVAALVEKLFNRFRDVDDWIHAALTLPDVIETPEDREFAVKALCDRLSGVPALGSDTSDSWPQLIRALIIGVIGVAVCMLLMNKLPGVDDTASLLILLNIVFLTPIVGNLVSRYANQRFFRQQEVKVACAKSLETIGDLRALGTLASHAVAPLGNISIQSRRSITRLLPHLLDQHDSLLNAKTSEDLARLLPYSSPNEAKLVLQALVHAGSPQALPHLEIMRKRNYTQEPGIRVLTDQTIVVLRQRGEEARDRSTLLRPSESDSATLLRPTTPTEENPAYLLHAVQPEDGG